MSVIYIPCMLFFDDVMSVCCLHGIFHFKKFNTIVTKIQNVQPDINYVIFGV